MKTLRYAFWAIVALLLILVGLANRGMVTLRAMPEAISNALGISPDIQMPLFVAIFIGVGVGLLLGFIWEWIREYKERAESRARAREVAALRRELAALKTANTPQGDDVLALLSH